jgi:hypothetical protein
LNGLVSYAVVATVGATVGAIELASRYRDSPGRSLLHSASVVYVLVNSAASMGALFVLHTLQIDYGQTGTASELLQVLTAGVAGLAVLRISISGSSYGDKASRRSVGALLDSLLRVADQQVNRRQARTRASTIRDVMDSIDYARAYKALPAFVLSLLEEPTAEAQARLSEDINSLESSQDLSEHARTQLLGVAILRVAGPDLLEAALRSLGHDLRGCCEGSPGHCKTGTRQTRRWFRRDRD